MRKNVLLIEKLLIYLEIERKTYTATGSLNFPHC